MRFSLLLSTSLILLISPALAQPAAILVPDDPAYTAWDKCVGENTADYAEMFGAVSIDDEDVTNAMGDCYDSEIAYREAHPGVPDTIVTQHKDELKSKWIAFYADKKSDRVAGN